MSSGGDAPDSEGGESLPARLERLLRNCGSRLDSIRTDLPSLELPSATPQPESFVDYFPDEVVVAAPKPAPEPAPVAALAPTAVPASPPRAEDPRPVEPLPVERAWSPPRLPSLAGWAPVAAGALAILAALRWIAPLLRPSHSFYALAGGEPSALAAGADRLYILDAGRQALLEVSLAGRILGQDPFAANAARGLTRAPDGSFWTTEGDQAVLFERGPEPGHPVRRSYAYHARRFGPIAPAGDGLWAVDPVTGALYRYLASRSLLGTSLTPVAQYEGNAYVARSIGVAEADDLLWFCDPIERKVARYRPIGLRLAAQDWTDLGAAIPSDATLTGMTLADGELWLLAKRPAGLHRLRLSSLVWKTLAKSR